MNTVSAEVVRLKWSQKDRAVLIEGEEEDRFFMKVQEVIQACNLHQVANEFESQFANLKNLLGNWIQGRKSLFHKAFITVRDGRILFLVISKDIEYNPEVDCMLTDLDLMIAQTPFVSGIPLSVQSLPRCDTDVYEGFLSPPIILEYDLS
jgi:hypothetical protein